ncbi:MAG: hypothetical protein JST00_22360 [Deltaproteobacteria bacterium]|nr:hypothetical protein [Deltaproteobacteria bacterium]
MDVVAVVGLGAPVESEAPALAADLGITAYEAALMLRVPSPMLVLRTDDRARTLDLVAKLRGRGHQVVACDTEAIATGDQVRRVKTFRLEADALVTDLVTLGWTEIVAIVRAVHRTTTERVTTTERTRVSIGRAALSGGLAFRKTEKQETKVTNEEREQVLYVFSSTGAPLLFSQTRVRYEGLGPQLRPLQLENFSTLLRLVREHARHAPYDERLLQPRPLQERVRTLSRAVKTSTSAEGVDLLAHLVATAIARPPYR